MSHANPLTTANSQYYSRPKDERFDTLETFIAHAQDQKARSIRKVLPLSELRAVPTESTLTLAGPKGNPAEFTHWSFGQLSRMIGAPAGYLRTLPPAVAADCVNYGLRTSSHGADAQLLVRADGPADNRADKLTVRAVTSTTYSRLWDADVLTMLQQTIIGQEAGNGSQWTPPPVWEKNDDGTPKAGGMYSSDRDSFLLLINGGSIVPDPSRRVDTRTGKTETGSPMYRGLLISNSETGASSFNLDTILYQAICGNHQIFGGIVDQRYRRRHVGEIKRDTSREIYSLAYKYTQQSTARDVQLIDAMIRTELATTQQGIVDALRGFGATLEQATAAYQTAERVEENPRSYWGVANAITRNSQDSGHQDDRYTLDLLAAKVLSRAARLVAA